MRHRTLVAVYVLAGLVAGRMSAQTEPSQVDLEERVEVKLIQVEITVWPKDGDAEACRGLSADDLDLIVKGSPREIYSVDWLGSAELARIHQHAAAADTEDLPLSIVLYFDLWHLNRFHRPPTSACPMTKPLAFEEARRMVREELRPGDRLLLVTFAGWPQVHYGWIEDPDEALAALDRLEVSPFVQTASQMHSSHNAWIDGIMSLMLALGRYPGFKQTIYLGDDFNFSDIEFQTFQLAARAQANRVTVHAVDLLRPCRSITGIGCEDRVDGGLGCTPWRTPVALGPISRNTGGELFNTDVVAQAVRRIREMSGCRYIVSFHSTASDEKGNRAPRVTLRVRKPGFRLRAPISFQNPGRPPKEREEQDALFLLPTFGQGLSAEVGLWPLKPNGKRKRWNALMLARIRRTAEPWPEEMDRLVIEAVAHKRSKIYANVSKTITGEALQRLRDSDEPRLLVFPVEDVRPGEATVSLRASGGEGEVAANVRSVMTIPEPPGPGETGPWFLVDRLARAGEQMTMLPALDGNLPVGEPVLFVGYGCRGDGAPAPVAGSQVVALKGERSHPAVIDWLDEAPAKADGDCGWLVARIEPALEPGLWRFEPPPVPNAEDEDGSILFRVVR